MHHLFKMAPKATSNEITTFCQIYFLSHDQQSTKSCISFIRNLRKRIIDLNNLLRYTKLWQYIPSMVPIICPNSLVTSAQVRLSPHKATLKLASKTRNFLQKNYNFPCDERTNWIKGPVHQKHTENICIMTNNHC